MSGLEALAMVVWVVCCVVLIVVVGMVARLIGRSAVLTVVPLAIALFAVLVWTLAVSA